MEKGVLSSVMQRLVLPFLELCHLDTLLSGKMIYQSVLSELVQDLPLFIHKSLLAKSLDLLKLRKHLFLEFVNFVIVFMKVKSLSSEKFFLILNIFHIFLEKKLSLIVFFRKLVM